MTRDDVIAYLREQAVLPFVWGSTDCVRLAAGLIERATGTNPSARFSYSSEIEAKRELVARGGLEAAVTEVLGPPQNDLRLCADGDIVLTAFEGSQALGIALPRVFYVRRTNGGLYPVDLTLAIRFWPCRSF